MVLKFSLLTLVYRIKNNQAIAKRVINWYSFLNGSISEKKKKSRRKPARIPLQTPPAGGKSAEAGRIHSPRQIVSPCRVRFNHFRFRFLDLCIRFGKIISKVCEGFNSGALKTLGKLEGTYPNNSRLFYHVALLRIP